MTDSARDLGTWASDGYGQARARVDETVDGLVATGQGVKAADAVVAGAKTVAGSTKNGLSKTGEVMTDGWITARVNERFVGEKLLKDSDINVDTDKHVVTLKGTVITTAGRRRAGTVAQRTEGVDRVVNQLAIGAKKS